MKKLFLLLLLLPAAAAGQALVADIGRFYRGEWFSSSFNTEGFPSGTTFPFRVVTLGDSAGYSIVKTTHASGTATLTLGVLVVEVPPGQMTMPPGRYTLLVEAIYPSGRPRYKYLFKFQLTPGL